LEGVSIPSKTAEIGSGVFSDCSSLKTIEVNAENTSYVSIDGVLFTAVRKELHSYPAGREDRSYDIPDGVEKINYNAFTGSIYLGVVSIPDSVEKLGEGAFANCTSLKSAIIPGSVSKIGDGAFDDCPNLTLYVGPDSVAKAYATQNGIKLIVLNFLKVASPTTAVNLPMPDESSPYEPSALSEDTLSSEYIPSSAPPVSSLPGQGHDEPSPSPASLDGGGGTASIATREGIPPFLVWTFIALVFTSSFTGLLIVLRKGRAERRAQAQLHAQSQSEQPTQSQPEQPTQSQPEQPTQSQSEQPTQSQPELLREQLRWLQQALISAPPKPSDSQSPEPQQGFQFCSNCGSKVSDNTRFCINCGLYKPHQ
jgi:hypothetical protein